MASRFSLEASIEPTVDRRAADREGERLAGQFEDSLSDIGVDVDGSGIGDLGGGRGGVGAAGGGLGNTLVGLATQRNDLLAHIAESMEESFVGSGSGGGGGGGGMIGSILKIVGMGSAVGSVSGGGTLSSILGGAGRVAGSIGLRGAGILGAVAAGLTGILRYRSALMQQGRSRESIDPSNLQGRGDAGGIGGFDVGEVGIPAPEWLSDLTEWSLPTTPAGWMEDFISWTLPGVTPWMTDFLEWSIPTASQWVTDFIGWEFDTPAWIDQFLNWEFDSPEWINDFIGWEFTIPEAPGWVSQLLGFFDMGGGGGRSEAARRGGGFQSDQGLFNAAERQNQAANRNRTDVRVEPQINVDPQRLADDVAREAERIFSDLVSDVEDSLRESANNSNLGSGPRRFG